MGTVSYEGLRGQNISTFIWIYENAEEFLIYLHYILINITISFYKYQWQFIDICPQAIEVVYGNISKEPLGSTGGL